MDETQLSSILDDERGPVPNDETLGHIVARHRRRKAAQFRLVATTGVVVALIGAGVGVAVTHGSGTTASADAGPPPGLRWVTSSSREAPKATPGYGVTNASTRGGAGQVAPGEFGFVESAVDPSAESSTTQASGGDGTAVPSVSQTEIGSLGGMSEPTACRRNGCDIVVGGSAARTIFTRTVDGLTINAQLVTFSFAVHPPFISTITPLGVPTPVATAPASLPNPTAKSGTGAATSSGKPISVVTTCPTSAELLVTVSYDGITTSLIVPGGGPTSHPFSVVASAATSIDQNQSVALAIAGTGPGSPVKSVSATFEGGTTDSMPIIDGWAVLAHRFVGGIDLAKAGALKLTARSANGTTIETADLPAAGALATAPSVARCDLSFVPLSPVVLPRPPQRLGSRPVTSRSGSGVSGASGSASSSSAEPTPPPAG